jgi:nicotinamidase-related amidase
MPGADMDAKVVQVNNNHFIKHRMDAFSNVAFDEFLRMNHVNHLLITGIAAEECIDRTCRGALHRKYQVTVIGDAIAGRSDESRKNKLKDYEKYGATIIQSKAVLFP